MLLILGVGGFLIRNLLTAGPVPAPAAATVAAGPGSGATPPAFAWTTDLHVFVAVGIFASFFLEAFWWRAGGAGLRALLVTAEALGQVRIWRWPTGGKLGAHWLRLGLWLLLAGLWGDALLAGRFPLLRVAILHLAFVGGFGMVTLGIATRVVLSHTGHGGLLARQYRRFAAALTLVLTAAVARFGADFSPASFPRHLMYAGSCWLLGVGVWSWAVLRRVATRPPRA